MEEPSTSTLQGYVHLKSFEIVCDDYFKGENIQVLHNQQGPDFRLRSRERQYVVSSKNYGEFEN